MTRRQDPQSILAREAVQTLVKRGEKLIIVPHLYEFWAVATRPSGPPPGGRNGLGMTVSQTVNWLYFFQRRFTLLPDREELSKRIKVGRAYLATIAAKI